MAVISLNFFQAAAHSYHAFCSYQKVSSFYLTPAGTVVIGRDHFATDPDTVAMDLSDADLDDWLKHQLWHITLGVSIYFIP